MAAQTAAVQEGVLRSKQRLHPQSTPTREAAILTQPAASAGGAPPPLTRSGQPKDWRVRAGLLPGESLAKTGPDFPAFRTAPWWPLGTSLAQTTWDHCSASGRAQRVPGKPLALAIPHVNPACVLHRPGFLMHLEN